MAYTKAQVVAERRCGLKYVDAAMASSTRQDIIDDAIKISKEHPTMWGGGWSSFSWALMNAVREELSPKGELSQTWNLDEVLTDVEMTYVASALNITDPYKSSWPRR